MPKQPALTAPFRAFAAVLNRSTIVSHQPFLSWDILATSRLSILHNGQRHTHEQRPASLPADREARTGVDIVLSSSPILNYLMGVLSAHAPVGAAPHLVLRSAVSLFTSLPPPIQSTCRLL